MSTADASRGPPLPADDRATGGAGGGTGGAGGAGGAENIWTSYSTRDRTLLAIGSVACYAIFWFVGNLLRIPAFVDYQAALLVQPSPWLAILVAAVTFVLCVVIGSTVAGKVHFEGGLFCAAIGLMALSIRGGPMRYVLMYHPSGGAFVWLLIETVLLLGCVTAGWYVLMLLRDRGLLHGEPVREDDPEALPAHGAMALAAQVILMIFLMAILAQTDQKAQVIWAILIASFLSALGAHSLFPSRPSIWFWSAPFIVAVIGYFLALMDGGPKVGGQVGGLLPALARPLPLDYAAAGTAGALLGYWKSRQWQHEREEEPHTTGEVEEALEHPAG